MHPLRRLFSQTAVYGLSSIVGRFLNYLLVPLFTYYFSPAEYGVVSEFYAYAGFFSVMLLFGFETGYFRFRGAEGTDDRVVYATALRFVLAANLGFFLILYTFSGAVSGALRHGGHPEYVWWMAAILALDAVGSIAFAKLRAAEQAWRFVGVKLIEIVVNVALCLLLIVTLRGTPHDPAIGIGAIFVANLAASGVKILLLAPELRGITGGFDRALLGKMLRYSLPMVVIGFAGMINEMLDRALMKYLLPHDPETNLAQLGIYAACYKLSILMTLFVQAFRYAGEPFFFAHAKEKDATRTYALVLKWFVICCVFIFLLVTLYLHLFQYFIGAPFREGLHIVPILLIANLLLGVYVNLSIWYKLTDRTLTGAWVSIAGAAVTVGLLLFLVPRFGYVGGAWATLACYAFMAGLSYLLGRWYYPVPYNVMGVLGYILLGLLIYAANGRVVTNSGIDPLVSGTFFLLAYLALVWLFEGRGVRRLLAEGKA